MIYDICIYINIYICIYIYASEKKSRQLPCFSQIIEKYPRKIRKHHGKKSHAGSVQGNTKERPWKYHARLDVVGHELLLHGSILKKRMYPPWNQRIAPENGWLENEISFWDGLFSGAMLVFGRGLGQLCKYNFFWVVPTLAMAGSLLKKPEFMAGSSLDLKKRLFSPVESHEYKYFLGGCFLQAFRQPATWVSGC